MDKLRVSRLGALRTIGGSLLALSPLAAGATDGPPMRVGAEASEPFMEPFYAADQGFFTAHGLNVETQQFGNGSVTMDAVLGGALDIGNTDLIPLANACNRGVDLAIVAGGGMHATESVTIALCVAKNSAIRGPKDLEGQTIGVPVLKSTPQMACIEWLRQGGADPSKVSFFEMRFAQMAPALLRGTIAAALNGEPFITDSKADTRVLAVPADWISKHYYSGIWFGKRDYLNKNAGNVRKFIDATYQTARWANGHRTDSAAILARYSKIEVDRVRGMSRVTYATSLDPRLAQPLIDFGVRYKLIDKPIAAGDLFWTGA
jgi:NitT/TauT family transport system substrate-binding protein